MNRRCVHGRLSQWKGSTNEQQQVCQSRLSQPRGSPQICVPSFVVIVVMERSPFVLELSGSPEDSGIAAATNLALGSAAAATTALLAISKSRRVRRVIEGLFLLSSQICGSRYYGSRWLGRRDACLAAQSREQIERHRSGRARLPYRSVNSHLWSACSGETAEDSVLDPPGGVCVLRYLPVRIERTRWSADERAEQADHKRPPKGSRLSHSALHRGSLSLMRLPFPIPMKRPGHSQLPRSWYVAIGHKRAAKQTPTS